MKNSWAVLILLFAVAGQLTASDQTFGGIRLLSGYELKKIRPVEATIEKPGGLFITFESGDSEGLATDVFGKDKYVWYKEQFINGNKVILALVRPGVKTDPDLDRMRNLPPGNILLVSYPLGGSKLHAANFVGKIANPEEMVDMLLMVLTFDPSKGNF